MKEELKKKLEKLEKEISKEKGDFYLFAWVVPSDAKDMNVWDLLVSASWVDKDASKALDYLSEKLRKKLTAKEIVSIAKIVVLGKDHPIVTDILRKHQTKHETIRVPDSTFGSLVFSQACISTSSTSIQTIYP